MVSSDFNLAGLSFRRCNNMSKGELKKNIKRNFVGNKINLETGTCKIHKVYRIKLVPGSGMLVISLPIPFFG